ncbi:MAG: exodeoxyribonuclease III [Gammaproteobacteria bacterium]|nr:MAG: exodeoxyribonuclease III [Gammaproteobacteria bacterium]
MRIVTLNVNGLRAAARKGLFPWLAAQGADVVCLQEIRASEAQLAGEAFQLPGYHRYLFPARRPGYSGVALYCRRRPDRVRAGLGFLQADEEGRWLEAEFGRLTVASLYLPSGSAGPARQAAKYAFMDRLYEALAAMARRRRRYVICGDWNIAHKPIDLKNWRANQQHSGFLPEERAWLDRLFGEVPGGQRWVDGFRVVNQEPGQYTWWSNRGRAWEKNVGWRIDYQVLSPGLRGAVAGAAIYRGERFSDHAPLIMDYDL